MVAIVAMQITSIRDVNPDFNSMVNAEEILKWYIFHILSLNTSDIYVKSLQGISSLIENVISNKQTYRPEIPMLLLKTILNQMSSLSKPQKNFHHIINKHQQLLRQV